jgi:radical SAM-linked protein
MIKYGAVFTKNGLMAYISHLDLMTLFRRAIRRADLPFTLTKGFSLRIKISMERALKLGLESDSEKMGFYLEKDMDPGSIKEIFNRELPEGIRIVDVFRA